MNADQAEGRAVELAGDLEAVLTEVRVPTEDLAAWFPERLSFLLAETTIASSSQRYGVSRTSWVKAGVSTGLELARAMDEVQKRRPPLKQSVAPPDPGKRRRKERARARGAVRGAPGIFCNR